MTLTLCIFLLGLCETHWFLIFKFIYYFFYLFLSKGFKILCVCVFICVCICMCVYVCLDVVCMYIYMYVYICIYIYLYIYIFFIYILTNFSCIYWLLILTTSIKKVFRQFLTGAYSGPSRTSGTELSANRFEQFIVF